MGKKLEKAARMEHEVEPPLKTFPLANGNLKILDSYGHQLGDDHWAVWEKNCYREERGSMIDHKKVEEIAKRLEIPEKVKVSEIACMLENGANLGNEGEGRWPSEGPNNDSVYEFGARVADSI